MGPPPHVPQPFHRVASLQFENVFIVLQALPSARVKNPRRDGQTSVGVDDQRLKRVQSHVRQKIGSQTPVQ